MAHDFRVCKLCDSDGAVPTYVLPGTGFAPVRNKIVLVARKA